MPKLTKKKHSPSSRQKGGSDDSCAKTVLPLSSVILFVLLVLAGNAPLWIFSNTITPYRELWAAVVEFFIKLSGHDVVRHGTEISFAGAHWIITPECTAMGAMIVFVSFVIVYPSSFKAKGLAVLAGLPFLFVANLLRLLVLAWLTRVFPLSAAWFHDYLWQVAFLLLIVVMWLLWIEWVVSREKLVDISR